MTSLWARIEPLLARVRKPARHIGCEDGAATPRHATGKVSWLFVYPGTDEIGLPNQGLQILHETLDERDDATAAHARSRKRAVDAVRAAIEDLSIASSLDDELDDYRPRLCAVLAITGSGVRPTTPVAALSRTRPGRYDHSGAAHTAMDRARRRALGDHPGAPVRPAYSGGVRMRRDFRNGQPRHVGHDERHRTERG